MFGKALAKLCAAAVAVSLVAGCAIELEAPPIECTYRPSLIGAGKILRLENTSEETLREVSVAIRTAKSQVVHTEAAIGARQVAEVGWKKLGGFEIPDDAEIKIRARGFLLPLRVELAAASGPAKGERE